MVCVEDVLGKYFTARAAPAQDRGQLRISQATIQLVQLEEHLQIVGISFPRWNDISLDILRCVMQGGYAGFDHVMLG